MALLRLRLTTAPTRVQPIRVQPIRVRLLRSRLMNAVTGNNQIKLLNPATAKPRTAKPRATPDPSQCVLLKLPLQLRSRLPLALPQLKALHQTSRQKLLMMLKRPTMVTMAGEIRHQVTALRVADTTVAVEETRSRMKATPRKATTKATPKATTRVAEKTAATTQHPPLHLL